MDADMDDFAEFVDVLVEDELQPYRLPKRYIQDESNPIRDYSEHDFRVRYRFSKECVMIVILPLINQNVQHDNNPDLPIDPMLQLLMCLRFYATGSFEEVDADVRGFSQSLICRVIVKVSVLLAEQTKNFVKFPDTIVGQKRNIELFYNICGFPSVAGCVHVTHIPIANPGGESAEVFRNRMKYFSIKVQVVSGPQLEILDIVVRHPGSTCNNLIFDRSALNVRFYEHQLLGLLLGDSGYVCKSYLLTPLPRPSNPQEFSYNNSHSATRTVVERLCGVWKRRFPCLQRILTTKLGTSTIIICATSVLHNIAIKEKEEIADEEVDDKENNAANVKKKLAFRKQFIIRHF